MDLRHRHLVFFTALLLSVAGCRKIEDLPQGFGGFPEDIGEILVTNCSESGCHDDNSFEKEGRLSLTGWEQMFQGSRAGAAVIPHRIDQSYLLFFINSDTSLGITQTPTMPLNRTSLPREDVIKVRDWIAAGAPDENGNIKWTDQPNRAKIYVTNQGCDQVSVLDRDTRLVMAYVDIGQVPGFVEAPHNVTVSPDGRYWYVVHLVGNNFIEKYDARTDQFIGKVEIGPGSWNTQAISPDGKYMFAVDYTGGIVALANLEDMTLVNSYSVSGNPHGSGLNKDFTALYVTQQEGNTLNKLEFTDPENPTGLESVDLIQWAPAPVPRAMGPHEVKFTPEGDRYVVTCQYVGQVRIYQASNDSLLYVTDVGADPVELDFSPSQQYVYVTCMEDSLLNAGDDLKRGSVAVVDYTNGNLVKEIYTGYQPHGVAVDEAKQLVYIANRNASPNGPAPHHSTDCGGRNGYLTAIEMGSLELLSNFRHELSVDPYSVALRK